MNEIVLELAKQAGLKKEHGSDREYIGDFDWREFAELIVRECAEVIDAQKPVWQNTDVPAEIALDMAAKNIKAYFGVK